MESSNKLSTPIKNMALDDRPREKLLYKGAAALSDSELLAIFINTGIKNRTAIDLAKDILQLGSNNLNELGKLSVEDFMSIPGIKEAKAITLAAAFELGRRRLSTSQLQKARIASSAEVYDYIRSQLQDLSHEVFGVIFLNRANKILRFEQVSSGGISATIADPRIIFRRALELKSSGIILCHNHPSGNLNPSKQDEDLTKKLKAAGALLDIGVLDHLIFSDSGYYSFADNGLL